MLKKVFIFLCIVNISYVSASATKAGNYYVNSETLNVRLDAHKNGKKTNTLYKNQKVEVYEVLNGWARVSSYYSGKKEGVSHSVARWVSAKYLSKNKSKTKKINNNSPLARSLKGTDDYAKYQTTFISASEKLVKQGKCSINDFKNMGGWVRSSQKNKYYTYCGGMSKANRLYLNIKTGKVSK